MTQTEEISYPLVRQRHSFDIFVSTLIISLLLHVATAVFFAIPGRFAGKGSIVVDLDLQEQPERVASAAAVEKPAESPATLPAETALPAAATEPAPAPSRLELAADRALQNAAQNPEAVHESAIGLGMLSGHFASFAEGATLKDEIREYYFILMRRINEVWWTSGVARGAFANAAAVTLIISRDGRIIGAELLDSSGSREQDTVLLEMVKGAGPLPPLPPSYRWPTFNAPVRFVPPLRLMLPGVNGKNPLLLKHGG